MPSLQDPVNKKDIRVTEGFDLALTTNNDKNDLTITGSASAIETVDQIIRFALKTNKNTYLNDIYFGASARGKRTYMTAKSISDLRSFILENLRASNINPANHPMSVSIIPIGLESVSIQVSMFVMTGGEVIPVKVNSVFNESTQEVNTVRAFGA